QGVLVADAGEDDARLRAHLDTAAEGVPGEMHVTLMPTLACNLACTYCFQKDTPAFTKMSDEDRDRSLEWILRRIDERALSALHLHYFGGEPLTRKPFLLHTAEILHSAMRARAAPDRRELPAPPGRFLRAAPRAPRRGGADSAPRSGALQARHRRHAGSGGDLYHLRRRQGGSAGAGATEPLRRFPAPRAPHG